MLQLPIDVTPIFAAYLARNHGPVPGDSELRQPPNYGVFASLDGALIDLVLTFRAGSAYCCYEWGCHLNLHDGERWESLRKEFDTLGIVAPARLKLSLTVDIEGGALFSDRGRPKTSHRGRGSYEFAQVEAHNYHVELTEG